MTLQELRARFFGYWIQGTGNFAVVCSSGQRITLCSTMDRAMELKHMNCGRNCQRYDSPHEGYRLEPAEVKVPARRPLHRSYQQMVEAE
jgi:hypothetical protein